MKRVPAVENVGIAHTVCGPESFTPDHKPLLGPSEVDGFWLCCGFNSAGIMMSGGCGRELARWIDVGNTELDMFGYDVARFHRSYSNDVKWIVDRSHEAYAKNYSIVFPHDQPLAGRNVRHTPFHEKLIANGCFHQEILGWERPVYFVPEEARKGESTGAKPYDYYGYYPEKCEQHASHLYAELLKHEYSFQWPESMPHVKAEHEACRNGVVAFDMSAFGKIELSGEDAQAAVDWLATNRTDKGPGTCVYTMMCDSEGKVQSDLTVNCLTPERFYLVTPGASSQHDWDWIRREVSRKGFDVQMQDVTRDWAVLSVQGPKSRRLLEAMFERVGGGTSLSDGDFPFATLQEVPFGSDGVHIRMLRLTFAGELGWELHVPKVHASDVYDAVFSAGAEFGVKNGGYGALESLSLEKGARCADSRGGSLLRNPPSLQVRLTRVRRVLENLVLLSELELGIGFCSVARLCDFIAGPPILNPCRQVLEVSTPPVAPQAIQRQAGQKLIPTRRARSVRRLLSARFARPSSSLVFLHDRTGSRRGAVFDLL